MSDSERLTKSRPCRLMVGRHPYKMETVVRFHVGVRGMPYAKARTQFRKSKPSNEIGRYRVKVNLTQRLVRWEYGPACRSEYEGLSTDSFSVVLRGVVWQRWPNALGPRRMCSLWTWRRKGVHPYRPWVRIPPLHRKAKGCTTDAHETIGRKTGCGCCAIAAVTTGREAGALKRFRYRTNGNPQV